MVVVIKRGPFPTAPKPSAFTCPLCHEGRNEVKDSRPWHGMIRRRRRCMSCSHSFTTIEVTEEMYTGLDLRRPLGDVIKSLNTTLAHFNALSKAIRTGSKRPNVEP